MNNKAYYTVEDLKDILGVSRSTVYNLLKRNEFRWLHIGNKFIIPKKCFDSWFYGEMKKDSNQEKAGEW